MLAPEEVERRIREAVPGATVSVRDLTGDGACLEVQVVSAEFEGKPMADRHRLVYEPLRERLEAARVHALAIETFTPTQWEHLNPRG